jgi:hypothetical protein
MIAIKTRFDGEKVIVPPDHGRRLPPGEVILVFTEAADHDSDSWLKAQDETLS